MKRFERRRNRYDLRRTDLKGNGMELTALRSEGVELPRDALIRPEKEQQCGEKQGEALQG